MKEKIDEELVIKAKLGDKKSFSCLYENVYGDMYKFAYYCLKNEEDARDIVADTVMEAYSGIRKLKNTESFKSWIFAILSNKCKRQMKKYINERYEELDENKFVKEDRDYATTIDVRKALTCLNETEKMILILSAVCGYKSREISNILSIKEATIRSKQSRAYDKLKQKLYKYS